ncbi:hypothetical protein [Kitasatospora sp. NBC_01300]|uniref:hypothetical protein n=1 Tax=Kitasatospora sp. NBC_01300 TaxID=2903574 RepID=UPI00352C9564|nr:hypothetical protein OG556_09850 [Kitasatospora sp. NBC_01300]
MTAFRDHDGTGSASAGGEAGAASCPFPVVVEVRGVTDPARFSRLPDALAALLGSLRALPLSTDQQDYFTELFGPSAVQKIGHRLATFGEVRTLAFVGLTPHLVRLYLAEY